MTLPRIADNLATGNDPERRRRAPTTECEYELSAVDSSIVVLRESEKVVL